MSLNQILNREIPPKPWTEGENIPWNDPQFSKRMLKEHLSQTHDLASRRFEVIDQQVRWIHDTILEGKPTKILDLTCGPGLYTSRLSHLGHICFGIDFAPAAIAYAEETARINEEPCAYTLGDVRDTDFGRGYGLVMINNGQLNVFRRQDALNILRRAHQSLSLDGCLLLEPQKYSTVEWRGKNGPSWHSYESDGGLWSDKAHICLSESFWDDETHSATERFYIIDAETGNVTSHALTTEAYTENQYKEILLKSGFENIRFFPTMAGVEAADEGQSANLAIIAQKLIK